MESAADTEQMQTKAWLFRPETARGFARFYSRSTLIFWPITDLVTRAFIALPYFRSGLIKAGDWDKAVMLATYEYPVSWLSPEAAAATGLAIELIAPVLLLLGLLTRPAALALLILTIIAQAVYIPTTTNLMLIAMLIWYVLCGPSAISLDRAWVSFRSRTGPWLLRLAVTVGEWLRMNSAGLFLLAMRLWLGAALLALAGVFEPSIALATWLPITSFSGMPAWLAITIAVLLLIGAGASPVSYLLTFLIGYFMLAGAHPDVTFYPILLLAVYESRGAGLLSIDRLIEKWLATRFAKPSSVYSEDEDLAVTIVVWLGSIWSFLSGERGRSSNSQG